jgi:hypothetical protein
MGLKIIISVAALLFLVGCESDSHLAIIKAQPGDQSLKTSTSAKENRNGIMNTLGFQSNNGGSMIGVNGTIIIYRIRF